MNVLKTISERESSKIINNEFPEIKDKLENVFELSKIDKDIYSYDIIIASIDQKIQQLKVFDFNLAIKFKNIKAILFYLLLSFVITSVLYISNKRIFTESNNRIVHFNKEFVKPAPFIFMLENENLNVKKGEAISLKLVCTGEELPDIVYINIEGNNYLMKSMANGQFEYEINSVIRDLKFYFTDLKYKSESNIVKMLPKPGISGFEIKVTPPSYTGLETTELINSGDLQVAAGSKVSWNFNGSDIDSLYFIFSDSSKINSIKRNKRFEIESKIYNTKRYNVYVWNIITGTEFALSYNINVDEDIFPEIEVLEVKDSVHFTKCFFKGKISDDYGFSSLKFHYNIENNDSALAIPFVKSMKDQEFYYSFDFADLQLKKGVINYYFSVSDNDEINNFKTTTSQNYTFIIPDKEQLAKESNEKFDNIEKMLNEGIKLTEEIKENIKELQIKNTESNITNWQKSQIVNSISEKQDRLEKLSNQIKSKVENLNNFINSFDKQDQDIIDKQKQIEELFNEIFTDEIKKLLEEFNKLANEFDEKAFNKMSPEMNLTYEDLKKQMDRSLEMLKKMKIEQKIADVIKEIGSVAENEKNMADNLNNKSIPEEVNNKIKEDQNKVDKSREDLNKALEENQELKKPLIFDDFSEDFEDINKSFEESKDNIKRKINKKAAESIGRSSEKLQNLAFGMKQMLKANEKKGKGENIQNLKQILSNLLVLSFGQEEVLKKTQSINILDPALNGLNKQQKNIQIQSNIIKDSLYNLALRTPQIKNMVNRELVSMEINLMNSIETMKDGNLPVAAVNQQFVVTAANNLALMLNEALENLKKQMGNSDGDSECENPGDKKGGMSEMKKTADDIKQQLEKMIEQMKKGDKGSKGMSREMGQSLMQHEMMQQMLREIMNNGGVGNNARKQLQEIDNLLEQNRQDLINKNISPISMQRQNLIQTRLLEAEKAELEREFEDKRESQTADDFYSNPVKYFEYINMEKNTIEYMNKNSHKLNNFYTNKYKNFLNQMDKKE